MRLWEINPRISGPEHQQSWPLTAAPFPRQTSRGHSSPTGPGCGRLCPLVTAPPGASATVSWVLCPGSEALISAFSLSASTGPLAPSNWRGAEKYSRALSEHPSLIAPKLSCPSLLQQIRSSAGLPTCYSEIRIRRKHGHCLKSWHACVGGMRRSDHFVWCSRWSPLWKMPKCSCYSPNCLSALLFLNTFFLYLTPKGGVFFFFFWHLIFPNGSSMKYYYYRYTRYLFMCHMYIWALHIKIAFLFYKNQGFLLPPWKWYHL